TSGMTDVRRSWRLSVVGCRKRTAVLRRDDRRIRIARPERRLKRRVREDRGDGTWWKQTNYLPPPVTLWSPSADRESPSTVPDPWSVAGGLLLPAVWFS